MAGTAEWWLRTRNRFLADAGFQRWAARFWLTRPVARRRARSLFDLVAGFVYAQVTAACVRLELLPLLAAGPLDTDEIAGALQLDRDAARCLLNAAAAIDILDDLGNQRFGLGVHGAALLGNPGVAAMIRHHDMLYADLADPVAMLRREAGGRLAAFWPYASAATKRSAAPADVAAYSALMAASQPMVAEEIVARYRFDRHRHLLDIGGGSGTFLTHVARRSDKPALSLLDLPPVAAHARRAIAAQGLAGRIAVVEGDFASAPLPRGADVMTLVRILHDHDDATAQRLLCSIAEALPPGGTLVIAEPFAGSRGAEPVGHAYFGFYLFAMGGGRPRTPAEIGRMVEIAGFRKWRQRGTSLPLATGLIVARH